MTYSKSSLALVLLLSVVQVESKSANSCSARFKQLEKARETVLDSCADAVDCGTPTTVPNAQASFTDTSLGSTATYSCDPGHFFSGVTQETVCDLFQEWSEFQGTCTFVDCGAPPSVENGQGEVTDTFYDATVQYTCDDNFYFDEGPSQAVCTETGNWTDLGQCFCGFLSSDLTGGFTLPLNEFNEYDHNAECMMTIVAPTTDIWECILQFPYFRLGPVTDVLAISYVDFNGVSATLPINGTSQSPFRLVFYPIGNIVLHFTSDDSLADQGFAFTYTSRILTDPG